MENEQPEEKKKAVKKAKAVDHSAVDHPATCNDPKCPFHGTLSTRGRTLVGIITAARMRRTATFQLERRNYVSKYERYEKRRTVLKVHNPDCISAKEGDKVKIAECRPLSKTKGFVIIKKM